MIRFKIKPAVCFFFLLFLLSESTWAFSEKNIQSLLKKLENRYNLKLSHTEVPRLTWKVGYKMADKADYPQLWKYLNLFAREFAKYPPSFIKTTGLKMIVFTKDLSFGGQKRASIPDYYKKVMLYDFKKGHHSPTYQCHVIHHEYYHFIEYVFNGNAYYKDPKWAKFNEKGFRYGRGGRYFQRGSAYTFNHPRKGFVNGYSTSGLEEDKAEIFAALFIPSETKKISLWIKKGDEILLKKVEYMKTFLKKICSKMNGDYWKKIHSLR